MKRATRPPAERFWVKVEKTETCWVWTGAKSNTGYGSFFLRKVNGVTRNTHAHRWAYQALVGPIPDGMQIDHLCRNRACVRPDHLEAVTPRVNMLRGIAPAAVVQRTNRCLRDHEYTPENTYWRPDGTNKRQCRQCIKIRTLKRRSSAA